MKRNIFVAALMLFIVGCTSQQSDQLTQEQKDQIKSQLKVVSDSMVAAWNRMDAEAAIQYFGDSPDWVCFNTDGSRSDFQQLKKMWTDGANIASSYKWTTVRQDFIFVSKDVVICAWDAKAEMVFKEPGDKVKLDPMAYTAVFKKVTGRWKVVYSHESGATMIEKASKK